MQSKQVMTSHRLADKLLSTARLLLMKQDVELPGAEDAKIVVEYYDKEKFLSVVREMGSGQKDFGSYSFTYTPDGTILNLQIARSQVCKRIQEEKWECVPLLTPEQFSVTRE
jgi:hypothetical protein